MNCGDRSPSESAENCRHVGGLIGALVDEDLVGVICIDHRGRIVEANERGREVLLDEGGLRISAGKGDSERLSAHLPEDAEPLERVLKAALGRPSGCGSSASMVLGSSPDGRTLVLHCNPVVGGAHANSGVAAVIAIVPARPPVSAAPIGQVLGLTPTESRIAAALAQGMSVAEIARAAKVRRNTVHYHLKQCYGKTNCRTQADLVSLVLSVVRMPVPAQADSGPDG